MDFTVKETRQEDAWSREVDVEVDGTQIQSEIDDELKRLRKSVSIPGFRKGKVPMGELRARFGKDVEAEVLDRRIQEAVRETVRAEELVLLAAPRVPRVDYEPGQDLSFTAAFDVRPDIDLGDYDISVDQVVRPIDDAAADRILADLRANRAVIEVVDRPAAPGDIISANVRTLGPGQVPIVGAKQEQLRFLLDEESVPAAWIEGLTGRATGDTVTIAMPERRGQEAGVVDQAAEERYHQFEISQIESRSLPELDDAFAAEVAKAESMAALRDQIKENLRVEEERRSRRDTERALLDRLADRLDLEIPERLLRDAADELYESALKQNPDMDDALRERLAVEANDEARRRLRRELVVSEVRRREGLEATAEEAEAAFRHVLESGMEPPADQGSRARMVENVQDSLSERKVLNFLIEKADVQVIEQGGAETRIVTP